MENSMAPAARSPVLSGLVLAVLLVLAGCQLPSVASPPSRDVPTVTPAAVPKDEGQDEEGGDSPVFRTERYDRADLAAGPNDLVVRNDRNVSYTLEVYVDPGGTDAVDVQFANGTTARLNDTGSRAGWGGGMYSPFDPAALVGNATVVEPADPDAVILPVTVEPGSTVRRELPSLDDRDTVLYVVRESAMRPGRPNPVAWVDVLGCPTTYLSLTGAVAIRITANETLRVGRECTAPP